MTFQKLEEEKEPQNGISQNLITKNKTQFCEKDNSYKKKKHKSQFPKIKHNAKKNNNTQFLGNLKYETKTKFQKQEKEIKEKRFLENQRNLQKLKPKR